MKLKITLVKGRVGRLPNQDATLTALGLKKMNSTVTQPNNAAIRGMINTVHHLVKVEEVV